MSRLGQCISLKRGNQKSVLMQHNANYSLYFSGCSCSCEDVNRFQFHNLEGLFYESVVSVVMLFVQQVNSIVNGDDLSMPAAVYSVDEDAPGSL